MKTLLGLLTLSTLGFAQELSDDFKLRVGGYLISTNETVISATTDKLVGAKIDLQDDLGMQTKTDTFRMDGYYRFNDAHRIEFAYYTIDTDSSRAISKNLEWDGKVYSTGATIESKLYMDIYKLNYAYSFYHNDKVELSWAAGFHIMNVETGLSGSASVNGNPATYQNGNVTVLAPLPVIGFRIDYAITPEFHMAGSFDYFGISIDKYSGHFTDTMISAEYRPIDNLGIGLGLNATSLEAKIDDTTEYELKQTVSGFLAYLTFHY